MQHRWLGLVVLVIAACSDDTTPSSVPPGSSSGSSSAGSGGCGKGGPTGVLADQSVTVRGSARTYTVVVPEGTTPLPLVFVLHGSGGDGKGIRKSFDLEGEAGGKAVFVYPDAVGSGKMWDLDKKPDDNADIALFDALLAALPKSHCIDESRVFVAGFSAGGYFANQLACRRGNVLRGVASHGGGGPYGQDDEYDDNGDLICAGGPVAALVVHGTDDGSVSLEEGQKSRDHWRRAAGCSSDGTARDPAPCVTLTGCSAGHPVTYCEIPGLGHSIWPAKGAKATWDFFASL